MRSQYLLANNNSPETITVKFEQCSVIGIWIGNGRQDITHNPYQSCYKNLYGRPGHFFMKHLNLYNDFVKFIFQAMSSICMPQVTSTFYSQTLLYFGKEHKYCFSVSCELDLEKDKIISFIKFGFGTSKVL